MSGISRLRSFAAIKDCLPGESLAYHGRNGRKDNEIAARKELGQVDRPQKMGGGGARSLENPFERQRIPASLSR